MNKKHLFIALFFTISFTSSLQILAGDMDGSSTGTRGGGGQVGGQVIDLYMNENRFILGNEPVYTKHVLPLLNYVNEFIPYLGDDLLAHVKDKSWYFVAAINNCGDDDKQWLVKGEFIACQDRYNILIQTKWYQNASDQNKIALILHEIVQALRLYLVENRRSVNVNHVWQLTERLLRFKPDDAQNLSLFLSKAKFGSYLDKLQSQKYTEIIEAQWIPFLKNQCEKTNSYFQLETEEVGFVSERIAEATALGMGTALIESELLNAVNLSLIVDALSRKGVSPFSMAKKSPLYYIERNNIKSHPTFPWHYPADQKTHLYKTCAALGVALNF